MENSEKIRAFALKVRAAKRLQGFKNAEKILDGDWHRWRDFADGKDLTVWSTFKDAAEKGLLDTRKSHGRGRGTYFVEYKAWPELERALAMPSAVVFLSPHVYDLFCLLRTHGECTPAFLANEIGISHEMVRLILVRLPFAVFHNRGDHKGKKSTYSLTDAGREWLASVERAAGVTI